jgi:hypothetical protein
MDGRRESITQRHKFAPDSSKFMPSRLYIPFALGGICIAAPASLAKLDCSKTYPLIQISCITNLQSNNRNRDLCRTVYSTAPAQGKSNQPTSTSCPCFLKAIAAVNPPIPPPTIRMRRAGVEALLSISVIFAI